MSCPNTMPSRRDVPYVAQLGAIPVHLTALQNLKKQSRKRLRFNPMSTVRPIDCSMTAEEKSRSFYTVSELNTLSQEAKELQKLHSSTSDTSVGLEFDIALRGLERHICSARDRNQVIARKAIIKYQNGLKANGKMTAEERAQSLATASSKLNQWSRRVALNMARLDATRALEGNCLIQIPDPVEITPFPIVTKSKRRRVSRRVSYADNEVNEPANKKRR
mmetsp:Transcript_43355/g.73965  ORF Transcript_43355/g.73965 Transcript_43355/m.73965 type:complete len:220 (+) Transcript_43355:153-812(+)